MKNFIRVTAMMGILALTGFAACKKYSNNSNVVVLPADTTGAQLNRLFSALRPAAQTYSVTAGVYSTVIGANGTVVNFYPNSFKDATGNIITGGTVDLQMTEMYKAGDMIRNRTSSTSGGKLLQSGGQLTLSATMGGQCVFANSYSIAYRQAASSNAPMQLFYGGYSGIDSVTQWRLSDTTNNGNAVAATATPTQVIHDSMGSYTFHPYTAGGLDAYYIFDSCTSFISTNCDHFYSSGDSLTSVSIEVPDTSFNLSNTELSIILPTINCVISNNGYNGSYYSATTHTFSLVSEGNMKIVPAGLPYKFVVMCIKGGNYYYYETSGTTASGLTIHATPATYTKDQVVTMLDAL